METSLREVTVYTDRARLTRRGKVLLEAGVQQLEIPDLPLQMDAESVRARLHGLEGARLLGVQVQRAFYTQTPAAQARDLENQIEAASDELAVLNSRIENARGERAALAAIMGHSESYALALAAGETLLEEQLAVLDGLRSKIDALDGEMLAALAGRRALERRIQRLKSELEQINNARRPQRYTALVDVELAQTGELSVDLVYVIVGASWKPLYDLRLMDAEGQLEVGYLAQVIQQTGEAWQDVSLTLSTARPAMAGTLPELDPWYIQPRPPLRPAPVRMAASFVDAEPPGEGALPPEAAPKAALLPAEALAEVDTSGAAVAYRVPGLAAIPGDGTPHKVTVARFQVKPAFDYAAAPLLVQAVYRRARAANDSPYLLLPGPANLFAGDEFIGNMVMELAPPRAELELYLGVDDRIKVERELLRRDVDKTLIGGRRRVRYAYQITLENLLPDSVQIELHDRIPVARHEEIKVRLESADPQPARVSELNLLDWQLTLKPQEKRLVRFDFTVEAPQAFDIAGLP